MKNTLILLTVAALCGLCSCTDSTPDHSPSSALRIRFSAGAPSADNANSRAGYNGTAAVWNAGDEVGLFVGTDAANQNLPFTQQPGSLSADGLSVIYEGTLGTAVSGAVTALACYPYDASATVSGTTLTTHFPGVQTYTAGGYTGIPLVASYTGELSALAFTFTNPFAIIELQLTSTDALTVSQIIFQGNNNEPVAGTIAVDMSGAVPTTTFGTDATTTLTLDCGAGVTLSAEPTSFYIAIPVQSYSAGYRFDIRTTASGANAVALTAKSSGITPTANTIYTTPTQAIATANLQMIIPDPTFRSWLGSNSFNQTTSTGVLIGAPSTGTTMNCSSQSISSLAGVEYFTNLTILNCASNRLSVLDISKNTALQSLGCQENKLVELNILQNPNLFNINCSSNQLTTLDASAMPDPTGFYLFCGSQTDAAGVAITLQLTLSTAQQTQWEAHATGSPNVEVSYIDS